MIAHASAHRKHELIELVTELDEYVNDASRHGFPIHEVERAIWQRLLTMGRESLGGFIASQGDGDLGETFSMPDGRVLKRLEFTHRRSYQSIFGEYTLDRVRNGDSVVTRPTNCVCSAIFWRKTAAACSTTGILHRATQLRAALSKAHVVTS